MPRLTVIIQGVALTYQKDGVWKTIFPFDHQLCHAVRFTWDETGHADFPLAAANQRIIVTSKQAATSTQAGQLFQNFLDLTDATYMHAKIRMKANWEAHAVMMTLENAVMAQHEASLSRYVILDPDGNETKSQASIGYSAEATIEADEIVVDLPGVLSEPVLLTADSTITIDNECYGNVYDENGDLSLLYDFVIEDADNPGIQFVIDRYGPDKPPADSVGTEAVVNNPEPGVEGLPCNMWTASETGELA